MATRSRYAGKVVIVTGGGRGIGAGIVRAFVESGAQVVICDKDELGGQALEQELPGTVFLLCDVTQEEDVRTLISETVRRFGSLDCVVNNAGYLVEDVASPAQVGTIIALFSGKADQSPASGRPLTAAAGRSRWLLATHDPPPQWPEETSTQGFRQLLELNLLGTYTLTKLALPHLRKSHGNVINISSLVGGIGQSQAVPYVATKGAVTAMTKALALDESQYGVRVNCISPGNIWTPLWEELAASTPDPKATVREGTMAQPLGRMGQPAEVGAAAVFLASEASFCTGIELLVTGGAELGYGCKARWSVPLEAPVTPF